VTQLINFGTPSVSLERLRLETRNLACRWTLRGTNGRNEKLGQLVVNSASRDPILEFRDPLHVSRTLEARNSKFGMQTDPDGN